MELRKDYILDRWVIIAPKREKRPRDVTNKSNESLNKSCVFCAGNEDKTPPEIGKLEKDGKWTARWFPNKYGFLNKDAPHSMETHNKFYTFAGASGTHEVLVETPHHTEQLHELPTEHVADILKIYANRITELSKENEYVVVFKNQGADAATSLVHSHTQIAAVNILPPIINEETTASFAGGHCQYCEIIQSEKDSDRKVYRSSHFISFCPYASRYNYEVWIFPKHHIKCITELSEIQYLDLAKILKKILLKLAKINASYNMVLHYAPQGMNLHFHIEIMPRIAKYGGFELGSGIIVNQVSPEDAAKFYREN